MLHTQALALNTKNAHLTANAITSALSTSSVTFASITYVSTVNARAAHKAVQLRKVVSANVQLFANIKQANVFANAVKKSANVTEFTTSSNYFMHTKCYSIVAHKTTQALYLYAIYNNVASTTYYANNAQVSKVQFAQYLTASAAKTLLSTNTSTHNVTNNVTHNVTVRTIKLQNIVALNVNKQQLIAS
jgi:hypothetical protein